MQVSIYLVINIYMFSYTCTKRLWQINVLWKWTKHLLRINLIIVYIPSTVMTNTNMLATTIPAISERLRPETTQQWRVHNSSHLKMQDKQFITTIRPHTAISEERRSITNKSVFSLVPWLSTWHCPHLLPSVVLWHRCCWACLQLVCSAGSCWSTSPARRALSSKPASQYYQSMGQTDKWADRCSTTT